MSLRIFTAIFAGLFISASCLLLAGCGAEAAPVSLQNSQFSPAGAASDDPATPSRIATEQRKSTDASAAADRSAASPPAANSAAAKQGRVTTPTVRDPSSPPPTIDQLKEHIVRLGERPLEGADQQERVANILRTVDEQIAAVQMILDSQPSEEDKAGALNAAMQIFTRLQQSGIPGAHERIKAFAASLIKRPDAKLARQGRYLTYNLQTVEHLNQNPEGGAEVIASAKAFLAAEAKDLNPATLEQIAQTAEILLAVGLRKDAVTVFGLAADTAKDSKDEEIAALESGYRDQAALNENDLDTLCLNLIAGEPDAAPKLLEAVRTVLSKVQPTVAIKNDIQRRCQFLDITGHGDAALDCLAELEKLFERSTDKVLTEQVIVMIANARKRAGLVGQPFTVEGVTAKGEPFNWAAYKGKVVLVDFWATWCGPCLDEIPNIQRSYEDFHELGFDVVGVNLDTSISGLRSFLDLQEISWTTVTSQDVIDGNVDSSDPTGFAKLPMAVKCGIDAIPFLVLVGKDGKVDSLHVRGPKLRSRLTELLGDPNDTPASDKPASDKPAPEKAAEKPPTKAPGAAKPAGEKPAKSAGENRQSAITPVGFALAAALLGADEPAAKPAAVPAAAVPAAEDPAINPYSAKPGLSSEQLAAYLLKMLDKPKTIQSRPGFCEAVCEACDRLMSASPPATEAQFFVAIESKFETLHKKACTGDAEADKQLAAFTDKMKADERPRIARQVAFFQEERKVLDAIDGPMDKVPVLLKELQEYFAKEKLGAKHLRMASSTVALINRLADGDEREKHFADFGKTFATSSDKELARYGKKLAKKPAATESDLVGKPLELAGTTAKGAGFGWDAYRGKVVLVDFWATWCGPCRREMPHVKDLHEKLTDKGFDVVGVSLDEDQEALAAYLEENAIPWETLAGEGTQELAEKYGVRGIPTMMLVDKEGKIVGVAHNVEALAPLVEKLMAAPAAAPK